MAIQYHRTRLEASASAHRSALTIYPDCSFELLAGTDPAETYQLRQLADRLVRELGLVPRQEREA